MKTRSGYETNGDYIKYQSGYTKSWIVETENQTYYFSTEYEADMYIITKIIGCEKAYPMCNHYKDQEHGCNNCEFGWNKNCANSETHPDNL